MRCLILSFLLAAVVSCVGGKSTPVQYYTLDTEGSSDFKLYVREVSAGSKVHERFNLQNASSLELREFERWEDAPRRIVETEMKKYFALGDNDLRSELNEFVFDVKNMEARIIMDFVYTGQGDEKRIFRISSSEAFASTEGDELAAAMSKALTKIFVKLDQKLNEK